MYILQSDHGSVEKVRVKQDCVQFCSLILSCDVLFLLLVLSVVLRLFVLV